MEWCGADGLRPITHKFIHSIQPHKVRLNFISSFVGFGAALGRAALLFIFSFLSLCWLRRFTRLASLALLAFRKEMKEKKKANSFHLQWAQRHSIQPIKNIDWFHSIPFNQSNQLINSIENKSFFSFHWMELIDWGGLFLPFGLFGLARFLCCGAVRQLPPLTHNKLTTPNQRKRRAAHPPRFIVHSKEIQIKIFISFPFSIRLGLGASLLFGLVACGLQPPLTHPKTILLPSCSTHNFIHS